MMDDSNGIIEEKPNGLSEQRRSNLKEQVSNDLNQEKSNEFSQNNSINKGDSHQEKNKDKINEEISEKQNDNILEINNKKWINDCKIINSVIKKTFFQNYNVYEISFKIENINYLIKRKFSDFLSFREILRKMYPCIFLLPLNKKGFFVTKDNNFIRERIVILQNFLYYLIENKNIFDCEPFWLFFDSSKEDSDIGVELGILMEPNYIEKLDYYKNIFPIYFNNSKNISSYYEINQFVVKINTNLEFYKRLRDISKSLMDQKELKKTKVLEDFFNNIIIPLSDEREIYKEFSKNVESVEGFNLREYFQSFKDKLEDLLFEIDAYKEIFNDFEKYNKLFLEKNNKKISHEKNLVALNNKEIVNLEKISNAEMNLENIEKELGFLEQLIEIFYQIIKFREMNIIKKRKKLIVYKSINILAKQISNLMREKLVFWGKIKDFSEKIVQNENP